jgi:hypothetical protein
MFSWLANLLEVFDDALDWADDDEPLGWSEDPELDVSVIA